MARGRVAVALVRGRQARGRRRHRVRGIVPAEPGLRLVAVEAHGVLRIRGFQDAAREVPDRRAFLPAAHAAGVRAARPVAGLALQLAVAEGARMGARQAVRRAEDLEDLRVLVTAKAGVGAPGRPGWPRRR